MNLTDFLKNGGEIHQSQYVAVERPIIFNQDLSTNDMSKILENGEIVNDYAPGDIIDYDHEMSIPVKDTGIEYIIYQGTTPTKTCDTFQDAIKYVQENL